MKKNPSFLTAFKEVYLNKKYYYLSASLAILFFSSYIFLPITLTPGHSLALYISMTSTFQWIIMALLSLTLGVLISFQVYLWRNIKFHSFGKGVGAGFSGLVAFIVSIGTCVACSVTILTLFLPITGVLFISQYIWQVLLGSLLLALFSIYLTARAILGYCKRCVY